MPEFGAVNKERDLFRKVEQLEKLLNSLMDEMKDTYQTSIAQIISKHKDRYIVHLIREDKKIDVGLSSNMAYWTMNGIPQPGEYVRIQHQKDLFNGYIIERASGLDYVVRTTKKNGIMSAKGKQ